MTSAYALAWLRAFLFTQLIEAPIYRRGYGASLAVALGASTITHPVVWFVFFGPLSLLEPLPYAAKLTMAELFAWLVESAWLARATRLPGAVRYALLANAASLTLGMATRALFGFP